MRRSLAMALVFLVGCGAVEEGVGDEVSSNQAVDEGAARIEFLADWTTATAGVPAAGEPLVVAYDLGRLPDCRSRYHGLPTWEVLAFYRFDGGAVSEVVLTKADGTERLAAPATIEVPPEAGSIELWFMNSDNTGCVAWDSRFGENYRFSFQQAPTLGFRADWTTDVQGRLEAGGTVIVSYDPARLPACRGTYYGYEAWSISAHYRFDGGEVATQPLTQAGKAVAAHIEIPAAADGLELWFENNSRWGCQAWDSAYGENYRFSIE